MVHEELVIEAVVLFLTPWRRELNVNAQTSAAPNHVERNSGDP